jgi:hypothetical protein
MSAFGIKPVFFVFAGFSDCHGSPKEPPPREAACHFFRFNGCKTASASFSHSAVISRSMVRVSGSLAYSIKGGKVVKPVKEYPKIGERIIIDYGVGRDRDGHEVEGSHWWSVQGSGVIHGPFATAAEAKRDSEVSILGPQCEVKNGGQWDPAWDKPQ